MNERQAAITQGLLFCLMCFIIVVVCVVGVGIWFEIRRGNDLTERQIVVMKDAMEIVKKYAR